MELLNQHPDLDLVVLDLGMPGVSGTSLLESMVAALARAEDPRAVGPAGPAQRDARAAARRRRLRAEVDGVRDAARRREVRAVGRRLHPGRPARRSEPRRHAGCAGTHARRRRRAGRTHRTAGTGAAAAGTRRTDQDHLPRTRACPKARSRRTSRRSTARSTRRTAPRPCWPRGGTATTSAETAQSGKATS